MLAPAGTPPAVVAKLNEALNAAVATPEAKADLAKRGFVAMGGTPQQLGDWLKVQEPIWVPVLMIGGFLLLAAVNVFGVIAALLVMRRWGTICSHGVVGSAAMAATRSSKLPA